MEWFKYYWKLSGFFKISDKFNAKERYENYSPKIAFEHKL